MSEAGGYGRPGLRNIALCCGAYRRVLGLECVVDVCLQPPDLPAHVASGRPRGVC